jgi:probable rRNA maturation factor
MQVSGRYKKYISQAELSRVFQVFCQTMNLKYAEVSLVFCTSNQMRTINKKYRGLDKTTDVISFSTVDNMNLADYETMPIFLGEIIIDINYIVLQQEKHETKHSIVERIVHGLLHLAGFDHLNSKQKVIMQKHEHNILRLLKQDGLSD